jgi:hypothetical protein
MQQTFNWLEGQHDPAGTWGRQCTASHSSDEGGVAACSKMKADEARNGTRRTDGVGGHLARKGAEHPRAESWLAPRALVAERSKIRRHGQGIPLG